MHSRLSVISVLFLALVPNNISFAASTTKGPEPPPCLQCHQQLYEKDLLKKYIHQPFMHKKCASCHVKPTDSPAVADRSAAGQPPGPQIRWFSMSTAPAAAQAFLLPANATAATIVIDAKAPGKSPLRQSLTIPAPDSMVQAQNDLTPPQLTAIRADVQQGVLINAIITWRTDEKTDATVHYGIKNIDQSIEEKHCFITDHKITLPGLKSKSTYQVAITSQDIYGNQTTSPTFTFSTEITSPPHPAVAAPAASNGEIALKYDFLTTAKHAVMLEVTANQPVSLALGTSDSEPLQRRISLKKTAKNVEGTEEHPPLANKKYSSLAVCTTCHQGYNQQKSHPVNILPSGKTTIPPEYPTLPDGRISCMTCHVDHAANLEFRLIKSSRKELCLGCHPDKF